jgi:hypothetical protein
MKFVKLTSINNDEPIYINIEIIGHVGKTLDLRKNIYDPIEIYTEVGTCNNFKFMVTESIDEVLKLLTEKLK